MTSVSTLLRNLESWETTSVVTCSHSGPVRKSQSHACFCTSRWFVGSSRSRSAGWMKSARASATRMRQPPEKSRVFCCCRSGEKPRPVRMAHARVSAVALSSSSRRS
mmetsp:Transcript_2576/g.8667  ORF Transcript_2576/g.8667 Transcript_2576/m.8667 type:complete len:107 (-) Transcript_2576:771-1091(-)